MACLRSISFYGWNYVLVLDSQQPEKSLFRVHPKRLALIGVSRSKRTRCRFQLKANSKEDSWEWTLTETGLNQGNPAKSCYYQ